MRKFLLVIAGVFASAVPIALAAPNQSPTSIGGVPIPSTANSNQVMSNDAFKGAVKQYGTDATNRINQSVQQTVKSATGTGPAAPGSTPSTSTSSQQPASAPKEAAEPENYDISQQQPAANKPARTQGTAAPKQSQQPAAPQTYTGFGSGGQTNQNNGNSGSSDKNSNWNIGY